MCVAVCSKMRFWKESQAQGIDPNPQGQELERAAMVGPLVIQCHNNVWCVHPGATHLLKEERKRVCMQ